jgi:hypothetical protein
LDVLLEKFIAQEGQRQQQSGSVNLRPGSEEQQPGLEE